MQSVVHHGKLLRRLRRTCLYYDRVYISIINEIFNESSKFRM